MFSMTPSRASQASPWVSRWIGRAEPAQRLGPRPAPLRAAGGARPPSGSRSGGPWRRGTGPRRRSRRRATGSVASATGRSPERSRSDTRRRAARYAPSRTSGSGDHSLRSARRGWRRPRPAPRPGSMRRSRRDWRSRPRPSLPPCSSSGDLLSFANGHPSRIARPNPISRTTSSRRSGFAAMIPEAEARDVVLVGLGIDPAELLGEVLGHRPDVDGPAASRVVAPQHQQLVSLRVDQRDRNRVALPHDPRRQVEIQAGRHRSDHDSEVTEVDQAEIPTRDEVDLLGQGWRRNAGRLLGEVRGATRQERLDVGSVLPRLVRELSEPPPPEAPPSLEIVLGEASGRQVHQLVGESAAPGAVGQHRRKRVLAARLHVQHGLADRFLHAYRGLPAARRDDRTRRAGPCRARRPGWCPGPAWR